VANLKDIRNKITSIQSIKQVTKAMKMVAAAKLRGSQQRMEEARPYSTTLQKLINDLLYNFEDKSFELLDHRDVNKIGIVVVTSDRGLAGGFNSNVIKTVTNIIEDNSEIEFELYCIGKKGFEHFQKRNYNVILSHIDFWSELNFNQAIKIGDDIIDRFIKKDVDQIKVVYNYFKNAASQKINSELLLPLEYHVEFDEENEEHAEDILFEPSKESILQSLFPRHLNIQIWKYLLESYASEQAARMLAMDNATESATEMIKDLKLEFNKARQAAITTEMLEIVSGAEALN